MLLEIINLKKYFYPSGLNLFRSGHDGPIKAVDGVNLNIPEGRIVGLVGESGCGKTTVARLILRLIQPTPGTVIFEGSDVLSFTGRRLKRFRRMAQIIYQDPFDSLDPRLTVFNIIKEPITTHHIAEGREAILSLAKSVLHAVKLDPPDNFLPRFPHELSGGQRQRVAIARVLALNPKLIVADEPTSMLDVSVRGDILNLLLEMRDKYSISVLLITHDIPAAAQVCDRIAIMYLGKIVEYGSCEQVVSKPLHPYTKALISAIPNIGRREERIPLLAGSVPGPSNIPEGCRFHPRCPYRFGICDKKEPGLISVEGTRGVACFLYNDVS